MRHEAWLAATPEKAQKSRFETLKQQGSALLEMPPLPAGWHLIDYLHQVGPGKPGHSSLVAVDQVDIAALQVNQRMLLTPWESRMLRTLSQDYCNSFHDAREPSCPPPYSPRAQPTQMQRNAVDQSFRRMAAMMKPRR